MADTTNEYLKLASPPTLRHPGYPICDACDVETSHDGDGWRCPCCGTAWSAEQLEYDNPEDATLFEDWSGETLDGPACPVDLAWKVAGLRSDPDARDQAVRAIIADMRDGH